MTHPSLHSVTDAIEALGAALETADLSILQRQVLEDMRADLYEAEDINTFADVVELAMKHAKLGHY